MEIIDWIRAHWSELMQAFGLVWGLISLIVGLTPSTADDEWLRKLGERLSFFKPANAAGLLKLPGAKASAKSNEVPGALIGLLLCCAVLPATGCGAGAAQVHLETARATRSVVADAAVTLEAVCTVEHAEALSDHAEQLRYVDRCNAAREAQHLAVELWESYVVAAASDGLDAPTVTRLVARLSGTWAELRQLVIELGGRLPDLGIGGAA